jgi:ferredoxin
MGRAFVPRSDCPFCLDLRAWERWALSDLVDFAGDPELEAASRYTCLPHALMLIPLTSGEPALSLAEAVYRRLATIRAGDECEPAQVAEFFLARYPRASRSTFLPAMATELLSDARPPANAVSMKLRPDEAIAHPPDWDRMDCAGCLLCQAVRGTEALPLEGEAQGFCRPHARVLLAQAPSATVGQFVEWAPRAVEQRLAQRRHRWPKHIVKETSCPACRRRSQSIASVLAAVEKADPNRLGETKFCLPHLPLVLEHVPVAGAVAILRATRELLGSLHSELEEFFRKSDYRFQHEPLGTEVTAWLRAADILMGSYPPDVGYDTDLEARRGRRA